jgi:peptidoglycan/xylan/chitin deacetylase (PgdA/CDA1 family)
MLRIKARLKKVLPYVELLSVYHRIRNPNTLTVVVFHRVLAVDDARWPHAHPEWTVSDVVFDQCLQFFRRNYYVISLEELLSSVEQGKKLPNRSLLITFDDGYADNEEYALPLLERERVPAVLFLTSDFVNRKSRPWTEELVAAFRAGAISSQSIAQLYQALFNKPDVAPVGPTKQLNEIAERWTNLSDAEVEQLCREHLGKPLPRSGKPAHMLSTEQLRHLYAAGVAIGAHGKTHTSLPLSPNLETELREPRAALANCLDLPSIDEISTLAFPFGTYSEDVVRSAFAEGYKLLFTFNPALTKLAQGRPVTPVLDRVNVSGPVIAPDGVATPERLARCFFFVPHATRAYPA